MVNGEGEAGMQTPDTSTQPPSAHIQPQKRKKRVTTSRILLVVHRFAIFNCALLYVVLAFTSVYDAMGLLRGRENAQTAAEVMRFNQIGPAMGTATVRESPLVKTILKDSTTPVSGTLYLSAQGASFSECETMDVTRTRVFRDTFVRSVYAALVSDVAYNITSISSEAIELIVPVVDCMQVGIVDSDNTNGRFFYLVRQIKNPEQVSLLMVTMSNQQYTLPEQDEEGPAGVAVVHLIDDMRSNDLPHYFAISRGFPYAKLSFRAYEYINTTINGLWTLRSVPKTNRESVKILQTSCQIGFYIKAASEQSNVNNYVWIRETDATLAVSTIKWVSIPVLHDSWAWVHGVQFFIGWKILSNLSILCLTTYHNIRAGKWWIGDAMVTVSNHQFIGGLVVWFSWFMNEYWSLHEFCLHMASLVSDEQSKIIYASHTRVDMLTLYLAICGVIGNVFRERIDPLLAVMFFLIGYEARVSIINMFPALRADITAYSKAFYLLSVSPSVPAQEKISPMGFWTSHAIGKRNYVFVFKCLFPIYITLVLVVAHVLLRKLHRHLYPKHIHVMRNTSGTATSENERSLVSQKRVLTLFEIATGAQLEDRFGVVSDFEACVFVKAVKHASADGIYSTGFVIANGKFLVQTRDYWSIVLMKILRRRYTNIYVYDVDGRTVKQTARLVYPHTLTFADLFALNVGLLS